MIMASGAKMWWTTHILCFTLDKLIIREEIPGIQVTGWPSSGITRTRHKHLELLEQKQICSTTANMERHLREHAYM
jgi:hypothetical protein